MSKLKKYNQFIMNEEYGLSLDRTKQQLMIKELINNINPNFLILFSELNIQVTANNNYNKSQSGKFQQRLDIHKVSECIDQLIEVEKVIIKSGIIPNQFSNFKIDNNYLRLTFSIHP